METLLEKIASELENAAKYIESKEAEEMEKKEESKAKEDEDKKTEEKKKEDDKKEEEQKKEALLAPIKEKLSKVVDADEVTKKLSSLNSNSLETLELLSKGFQSDKVAEEWGTIEETKVAPKGRSKNAGYRDPIEAFAMGE
jgi:hypothetical protein